MDADWRTGKLCYAEFPAKDPRTSADFYADVFGWRIRGRDDGSLAFDDTVGAVSGALLPGRPPADDPRLLLHVMVADAEEALAAIVDRGGNVVRSTPEGHDGVFAWFADPAGNVLGIYQQPGLAEAERRR